MYQTVAVTHNKNKIWALDIVWRTDMMTDHVLDERYCTVLWKVTHQIKYGYKKVALENACVDIARCQRNKEIGRK